MPSSLSLRGHPSPCARTRDERRWARFDRHSRGAALPVYRALLHGQPRGGLTEVGARGSGDIH
eukprot:3376447-Alexandrium_andersonii.AAC.1